MPTVDLRPTAQPELAARLQRAIAKKTKPPGSLGALENLALQLGLIQQTVEVELRQPAIVVFAGDHGVVEEGISAYPQSVPARPAACYRWSTPASTTTLDHGHY